MPETRIKRIGKPINEGEIALGVLVTGVKQGITKNGHPYTMLTVEDFKEEKQFVLSGCEWFRWNKYFIKGWCLLIKGVMVRRRDEKYEFEFRQVFLLSTVKKRIKELKNKLS